MLGFLDGDGCSGLDVNSQFRDMSHVPSLVSLCRVVRLEKLFV